MFPYQNNNRFGDGGGRGGLFGSGYNSGGGGGSIGRSGGGNQFFSQQTFPAEWRFRVIRPPPIRGTESKTIVLPESVMQSLLQQNIPTPWFFEVENPRSSKKIIVGAPHFELADNGVGLPLWMRKAVGVDLMDFVDIRSIPQPPNATAVVVRGLKSDYADIPNIDQDIRQRLTDALSEYSTLNKESVIPLRLEPSAFATQHEFKIESLFSNGMPVNQASIIGVGQELHVEFDKPYQGKHAYKLGGDDEDDEGMRPGFVSSTGFQFNRHGLPLLPSTLERMTPSEGERFMRGPSPTPLPPRRLSNRVSPPASPPRPRFARAPETLMPTTTTSTMHLPESRSRMAYQTGEMEDRQDDAKRRATSRNNDSNAALLRYESIIAARRSPVLVDRQEEQVEEDEEIYIFEYDDDDEDEEEEEDDEIMNVD